DDRSGDRAGVAHLSAGVGSPRRCTAHPCRRFGTGGETPCATATRLSGGTAAGRRGGNGNPPRDRLERRRAVEPPGRQPGGSAAGEAGARWSRPLAVSTFAAER